MRYIKRPPRADGSACWSISGPAGMVRYDQLGHHLTVAPAGERPDSWGRRWTDRLQSAIPSGDDAVYTVLREAYELMAGGAR